MTRTGTRLLLATCVITMTGFVARGPSTALALSDVDIDVAAGGDGAGASGAPDGRAGARYP